MWPSSSSSDKLHTDLYAEYISPSPTSSDCLYRYQSPPVKINIKHDVKFLSNNW